MSSYRSGGFSVPSGRGGGLRIWALALLWLSIMLLPALGLLGATPRIAVAQSRSFHMDRYDSDIKVNPDGSLDVVETLVYVYDSGSFHRGTRYWETDRIDGISGIRVSELVGGQEIPYRLGSYDPDDSTSGIPGTFGTTTEGGQYKVRWVYDYTDTTKTFHLAYHVAGGMKVYDNRDEFDWYGVPPAWQGYVNQSRVQVTFPSNVDTGSLTNIASKPSGETSHSGNTITWTTSSIGSGGFEVGAQVPKGLLQPVKPGWQESQDAQEAYNKNVRPLVDLGLLVLSILLTAGGVLWGITRWYTKGRDKPISIYSDYITDPPSNLPPGLVGTLLDESADVRDVIATVVDLADKGNITIQEIKEGGIGGLFQNRDFTYTQTDKQKISFRYEEMVMDALFKKGSPISLSELKNSFYSDLPGIYNEMYRSVVALKYFPENPSAVRTRNILGGIGFLVLAGFLGFGAVVLGDSISWFLLGIPLALGVTGIMRLITAPAMPRKTDFGSEEAAKWTAFKRYLEGMQKYTNVQAAADKFQHYLPFAVAMGVDKELIRQFESVPQAMPPYYIPYGYGPGYYPYPVGTGTTTAGPGGGGPVGGTGMGGGPVGGFNPAGAMQGMSDSFAGAMQGMSDSFTEMVNSASNILTSSPQSSSSGGGWGGGGGGFGGGGGGGGGGGAD